MKAETSPRRRQPKTAAEERAYHLAMSRLMAERGYPALSEFHAHAAREVIADA